MSQFIVIPSAPLHDTRVPPSALATLAALASFADRDGRCWPSIAAIVDRTGTSASTVRRHLRILRDRGYLRVRSRHAASGDQTSNWFQLIYDTPDDRLRVPETCTPPVSSEQGGGVTGDSTPLPPVTPGTVPRELSPTTATPAECAGDLWDKALAGLPEEITAEVRLVAVSAMTACAIAQTVRLHLSGDRQPKASPAECAAALLDMRTKRREFGGIAFANYLRLAQAVAEQPPVSLRARQTTDRPVDDLRALGATIGPPRASQRGNLPGGQHG